MSKKEWTKNQQAAIDARGEQVLVSAAAGSGKTAVLTERVKNILSDEKNGCLPTEILVVTFTKAAAAEMRERIAKALKDEMKNNPSKKLFLKKRINLLPTADICTMDSFCAKVVRENFNLAKISSDFQIIEKSDLEVLKKECVADVLDELYENEDEAFSLLKTFFTNERNDEQLENVILKLCFFSEAYPSPEKWLSEVVESFNPELDINETIFAKQMYSYFDMMLDYWQQSIKKQLKLLKEDINEENDFTSIATKNIEILDVLIKNSKERNWDELVEYMRDNPILKYSSPRNASPFYKALNTVMGNCRDELNGLLEKGLPTSSEHKCDCEILYSVVKKLCEAVNMFSKKLLAKKQELNSYDFYDILHKCIDLLVEFNDDGTITKTDLAKELTEKYKEILIDEYQDTNEAQNILFEMISRDKKNFYCVGDVKQSIYRFRRATPALFMELKEYLPVFDGKLDKPTQIILEKNFRSRKDVTRCVNFIFSHLMSKKMGEIKYDENEYLYCGAEYPETKSENIELHILDSTSISAEESLKREARYIAEYIKNTVQSGALVKGENGMRPAKYDDFCIIARSLKDARVIYTDALSELEIPSVFEGDEINVNSREVSLLVSLIKAINNPLLDVPLVSVMLSPIFGFTSDELAEIRLINKNSDIYTCVLKYAEESEKAKYFIRKLDFYRNMAASYPIYDFVKLLVDDTAITEIFMSTNNSEERYNSIRSVLKSAENFSDAGRYGLSSFVRYLDSVIQNDALSNSGASAFNGVKIMTIHKSKGLEFPYVILANCAKSFNFLETREPLLVSRECGVGIKIRDDKRFTKFDTLSSLANDKALKIGEVSEELRILYVALTRAKEKLIFMCSINAKTSFERISTPLYYYDVDDKRHFNSFSVYKYQNFSEWICASFVFHEQAKLLREYVGMTTTEKLENGFPLKVSIESYCPSENVIEEKDEAKAEIDFDLFEKIKDRAEYVYPYDELSTVLAKINASSVEKHIARREFFASKKPKFIDEKTTGAKRGTVVHKFLELCDFKNAYENFENEISRLLSEFKLTEDEISVIDKEDIEKFFNQDVGKRLLKSNEVYKEYEFSVLKNAGEFYPDLPENLKNEKIVVQGKFDCAFIEPDGAVLIDYKTDKITDEETLVSIYKGQLDVYKSALEECIEIPVKETYIYSFKIGEFIKI